MEKNLKLNKSSLKTLILSFFSLLSILCFFLPLVYTRSSLVIIPVMGYKCLSYIKDSENTVLYTASCLLLFLLIVLIISLIFSLSSFFIKNKNEKKNDVISYTLQSLSLISSLSSLICFYFTSDYGIHINFGFIILTICCFISLVFYTATDLLFSKKNTK